MILRRQRYYNEYLHTPTGAIYHCYWWCEMPPHIAEPYTERFTERVHIDEAILKGIGLAGGVSFRGNRF